MAWEPKHRGEFTDIQGLYWRADIEEDAYGGDVMKLKFAGIPLMIEFLSTDDDPFNPIRGTKVDLTFYSDTDFQYVELYSVDNLQFRVKIYDNDDSLYFVGYVIVGNYEEPYEGVSYAVTVSAACGLGILKDIEYKDEGEYYNGRILESQIILDILGKIGHTEFKEFVNLYDVGMDVTVDDSPFDQIMIDVDIFQDMNCWEVLNHILSKYNAFIRQRDGIFEIIRPVELVANTVYGRYFTAATVKTPVSFTANQYIKRVATHPSETTLQVPGGALMIQNPASKVISDQDYGNKESWIDNWELKGQTYNKDNGTWDNWTNMNGVAGFNSINSVLPSEADGCLLPTSTSSRDYFIFQSFGEYLKQTNKVIYFSFDYLFYNFSGGNLNGVDLWVMLITADGAYKLWYYDQTSFGWTDDPLYPYITFETNGIVPGSSGWTHFELKLETLPADGPYIIQLCNSVGETALYTAFKNIRFGSTADEIITKKKTISGWKFPWKLAYSMGLAKPTYKIYSEIEEIISKEYIKENLINGEIDNRQYVLGDVVEANIDNIVEQFAGALMLPEARTRRDSVLLIGVPIGYSEILITCNGIGRYAVWNTSLTQTAADFVVAYAALYLASGVALTSLGTYIRFTGTVSGYEFYGKTTVSYHLGNLQGIVIKSYPAYSLTPTTAWNTRGGDESQVLIEFITDEIAAQRSRPKQLIQMSLFETAEALAINVNANMQDDVNTYEGDTRVFSINKGEFDVRNRAWMLDLFEIGAKTPASEEGGPGGVTVDSTIITVDSTIITSDNE